MSLPRVPGIYSHGPAWLSRLENVKASVDRTILFGRRNES
jgi:hypothetical protein